MITSLLIFALGILVGGVGAVAIYRNNLTIFDPLMDKFDAKFAELEAKIDALKADQNKK